MRTEMVEVMRDQVQAIYRALTGHDLTDLDRGAAAPGEAGTPEPAHRHEDGNGHGTANGGGGAPGGAAGLTAQQPAGEPDFEALEQHFSELEALARTIPALAGRVPPFSFTPLLDAAETERAELILELAVPGVSKSDLVVTVDGETVRVSGLRRGLTGASALSYLSAEIPRGPFYRQIRLGFAPIAPPHVEVSRGIVRISISTTIATATEGSEHDTRRNG